MQLEGKAAIITAGATGMGGAAASALAQRGVKVAVLGRRKALVEAKADQIGGVGIVCDVSDPSAIDAALEKAEAAHGPASILINSAADGRLAPLFMPDGTPFPREVFGEIIATNLLGPMYMMQAFASRLIQMPAEDEDQRGVIINVSSSAGSDSPIGAAYVAAKGGLNALCLSIARELSPWRIRVMTIAPGAFDSDMLRQSSTPAIMEEIARGFVNPQRIGDVAEFAGLAVHICENDFLNGSIIRLDGAVRRNSLRPMVDPKRLSNPQDDPVITG